MVYKAKGSRTKDKILQYAKQEFYEKGYENAWVKSIAKKSGTTLGNITYYFSKKDDMVTAIYSDFVENIYSFIDFQYTEDDLTIPPLQKYCMFLIICYHTVLNDENNIRFYHEIILKKSNYRVLHKSISKYYADIIKSFELHLSDKDYSIFILTQFGSRREIFLSFFAGDLHLDLHELIYYLISNMCRNLGINQALYNEVIEISLTEVFKFDFSNIKFLI
ncbi:MAG: TetR/AcrR family transcriptional regulator [Eubacteriaceae bacterium]